MSVPKSKQASCCRRPLNEELNILCCRICNNKFHLTCINLKKTANDISEEFKQNWLCPGCRSKVPKTDNTPARCISTAPSRSDNYDSDYEDCQTNVTVTRGSQSKHSATDIRYIVRDELKILFDDFKSSIVEQFQAKTAEIIEQITGLTNSIKSVRRDFDELKQEVNTKSNILDSLVQENQSLRTTIAELNSRLSQVEQYSRDSNIEIQCLPEYKSENLTTTVKQLAKVTGFTLNESDIHVCKRTARINNDSQRPRSVIVKFGSPIIRDGYLAAVINFNKRAKNITDKLNTAHLGISGEKLPIFVCEHLSPVLKSLHAAARSKAKELNYRFVWIRSGRVYMRKDINSEYILVKNADILKGLK